MSEDTTAAPAKNKGESSSLMMSLLPLLVLFGAAIVLFWLSQQDMAATYKYWEIFVPVVAVISLVSGWSQAFVSDNSRLWYLIRQIIQWGLLIGLLYVLNAQGIRELMSDQQYTALVLYLLAFTTLVAAVQMDYKLLFFGVFLVFCAYLIMVPGDNPTLIGVGNFFGIADPQTKPLTVSMAMAATGFVASLFVLFMMRGAITSKRVASRRKAGA
ncbi:MAG: hypothetical protein WBG92_18225 [Thiohalocapsa sp.]